MPFMQCGHTATSLDDNNNPFCALCSGLNDGFNQVVHHKWEGRTARCVYCDSTTESNAELPLFMYNPDGQYDSYYCGCRDWR